MLVLSDDTVFILLIVVLFALKLNVNALGVSVVLSQRLDLTHSHTATCIIQCSLLLNVIQLTVIYDRYIYL